MRIVYKILRILLKVLGYIVAFVLLLPVLIIIALQIPPVQHFATKEITQTLSAKIHSKVKLERVSLGFLRTLQLKGVYIEDQSKDTLLYAKKIEVDVNLLKLINHEVLVNKIKLDGVYANVYRNAGKQDFNYAYIAKAFQSKSSTDTTKSTWKIELQDIRLSNIRLRYDDVPGGMDLETALIAVDVDFKSLGLDDNHMIVDEAKIDGLKVAVNLFKVDSAIVKQSKDTTTTKTTSSSAPMQFTVNDISIDRTRLVYNNYLQKAVAKGIDYNRIDVYNLKGDFKDIDVKGANIAVIVNELSLKEKSGIALNALNGKINMQSTGLTVDLNKLKTENSDLHNALHIDMPMGKGASIGETAMKANFKEEIIAMKDLLYFMPAMDSLEMLKDKKLSFSGNLKGKLKDFTFKNVALKLDGQTSLKADIIAKGLPDVKKTYFDLDLKDLNVNSNFIASFMPKNASSGVDIPALGQINIKGKTKGYAINSASDFTIKTAVGIIVAKAAVTTDTSFNLKSYQGNIVIAAFNLGKVLKQKDLGKLTMQASATGEGMNVKSFEATVASVEYNKYIYHKLSVSGSMVNKIVKAALVTKDTSFTSDLKLVADLKKSSYKADGKLSQIDLYDTHFMTSPLTFSMDINADVQYKTMDSILGYVRLHKLNFTNNTQNVDLDSFIVNSKLNNGMHTFTINSPLLQAEVAGKFDVNELPGIYNFSVSRYKDTTKLHIPNQKHTKNIELVVKAGNLSPLTQLFVPQLTVLEGITFTGSYTAIPGTLKLAANVQSVTYGTNHVNGIAFTSNGNSFFTDFTAGVESIVTGSNTINKTIVSGTYKKDNLKFNLKVYDQKAPTHLNLDAALVMRKDTFILNLPTANIFIKGKQWDVNDHNKIVYAKDYLVVKDFELSQGNQKISLMSTMAGEEKKTNALIENINLSDLAELGGFTSYKIKGALNGRVEVTDMFTSQGINASISLDSLGINNQSVGNLKLTALKQTTNEKIDITLNLKGPGNDMSANGYYSMAKGNPLQFDIKIAQLALHPLQPFAKAFAYSLDGNITANFKIGGTASAPSIAGNLLFDGPNAIGLVATNSLYRLTNQQVIFNETSIQLNKFTIQDSSGNQAVANGYMFHNNFKNIKFAMTFDTDNFQLIDSEYAPDVAVYGHLYAALHVKLNGPLEDLIIHVNATTNKGTVLNVPLASSEGTAALPSYVHFSKIEEATDWSVSSAQQKKVKKPANTKAPQVDLSKFDIRGNINLTKDATLNIVIDPVNGDQVQAIGHGSLSLDFNSQNDINIYGMYTIDSGSYNFSFASLVKKNFKLKKGSTISWAGDPENAKLNLTAVYVTSTSRYELVEDQASFMSKDQIQAAKRILPVDVYLNIGGEMLAPAITFDLSVPEGNDPLNGNIVSQRISQIRSDPNELNKQVFSLIVLGKFMTTTGTTSGGSGNLAMEQLNESVSKVLNQELNKLSNDYLKGIQLNVNVQSLDPSYGAMAQNAQVSATKQINSRISVSAGGNVNVNSNYGNGQFAGDYDVYYRVNPNGTITLKFFRTSSQNMYTNGLTTQTGFSLNTRKEFNKWKYLFKKDKHKKDSEM